MKFILFTFALLLGIQSFAFIPKSNLIFQRLAENAGNGIYQIEQEVQFPSGSDLLALKETWLIENENNMKLLVTGTKELKDQIFFFVNFSNGIRTQSGAGRKLNESFFERYFHSRNSESFAESLVRMKVLPPQALARKAVRSLKEVDNKPESFVRLARTNGVISYAFGTPSEINQDNPGFWVEQDQFVLRKIRLPDQTEISADRYSNFARGLSFPRTRTVRWGINQVTIQTLSVTAKTKENWNNFSLKFPQKMDGLNNHPSAGIVEDFYKRFR